MTSSADNQQPDNVPPSTEPEVVELPLEPVPLAKRLRFLGIIALILALAAGVGRVVSPSWSIQEVTLDPVALAKPDSKIDPASAVPPEDSGVTPDALEIVEQEAAEKGVRPVSQEALIVGTGPDGEKTYTKIDATVHYGFWSLLPAIVAIVTCWIFREPLTSILLGTACGALILQKYDFTGEVLIPSLATINAAGVLVLYLWLLGGLLGIWARTGTAQAFAEWATRHFVRGPRTAKLVAWGLGVLFFQGGTVSTVLVGTSVRPIADQQRVSHEELSYVVDSTASPIAILVAFNAWPAYVATLIFVPGVAYLATEEDRLQFFFSALPLSFYAIFAVLGTLLLSLDLAPFLGKRFRQAIHRSRTLNQLDHPDSTPMSFPDTSDENLSRHLKPHAFDFMFPLLVLTGVAVGTFALMGSPQVHWAFAAALVLAAVIAMARGMSLHDLIAGVGSGLQSVVLASAILLMAITLGGIMKSLGGGAYVVALLGDSVPYWLLPMLLFVITVGIAFSTGTSWGTFAVAFPLAMPLAIALAQANGLGNETLYVSICFACVLNGSVFGDQCSPISDTTVLSAMTTGADLMDHVLTQIVPASAAAALAIVCWTLLTVLFC